MCIFFLIERGYVIKHSVACLTFEGKMWRYGDTADNVVVVIFDDSLCAKL